jgi:hypothetical protein
MNFMKTTMTTLPTPKATTVAHLGTSPGLVEAGRQHGRQRQQEGAAGRGLALRRATLHAEAVGRPQPQRRFDQQGRRDVQDAQRGLDRVLEQQARRCAGVRSTRPAGTRSTLAGNPAKRLRPTPRRSPGAREQSLARRAVHSSWPPAIPSSASSDWNTLYRLR